jgi:hypothetical protein
MNCPTCGHEIETSTDAIQAIPDTVVYSFKIWISDVSGHVSHRLTEPIPIVCIKSDGTAKRSKPTTESKAQQPR